MERSDGHGTGQCEIDLRSRLFGRQNLDSRRWIDDRLGCERESWTDIIEIATNDMDIGRERFQVVHCFFGA